LPLKLPASPDGLPHSPIPVSFFNSVGVLSAVTIGECSYPPVNSTTRQIEYSEQTNRRPKSFDVVDGNEIRSRIEQVLDDFQSCLLSDWERVQHDGDCRGCVLGVLLPNPEVAIVGRLQEASVQD
jgi:hypothetical protein